MEAWFDAADTTTITHSNGAVSQWDDKSGKGKHLGQSTSTNQPLTGAVTVNGENALQFTNDFLFNPDGTDADIKSVVMVTKNNTAITSTSGAAGMLSIYGTLISAGDGLGSSTGAFANEVLCVFDETQPNVYVARQGVSSGTLPSIPVGTHLYSYVRDNDWFIGLDGSDDLRDLSSGTRNDLVLSNGFGVGAMLRNLSGAINHFDGSICEVILLSTTLTEPNRQRLEGHLAHKWGLEANLPASHPYKMAPPTMAGAIVNLNGTAMDPDGDTLTTTWSLVSGTAAVEFGDASALETTATFTANGTYILRLTASDGYGTTSDDIIVQIGDLPTVTEWPTAAAITEGQTLVEAVLSGGSASVPGTFSYDHPEATPEVGTFSAAVTFTPTDTTNYLSLGGNVDVTVLSSASPFDTWAASEGGGVTFQGDANGDGIADGMAWLLGAETPSQPAHDLLPKPSLDPGGLVLHFKMRNAATRGSMSMVLQFTADLGMNDPWENHSIIVPDAGGTVDGIEFLITPDEETGLNQVRATIPESAASLFARLKAEPQSP